MTGILLREIDGLPYKIGQTLHVNYGRYPEREVLWHVWLDIIAIPLDAIQLDKKEVRGL